MTQLEYDLICEIIRNGAPALAARLTQSLANLITDYNVKTKELESIKSNTEKSEDK